MRQIDFISNEHQKRFEELIEKDRTSIGNNERRQLFYVIAGCDDLWKVKDKIYDFTNHELGMYDPRHLSSSLLNIYRRSLHLYNFHRKDIPTADLSGLDREHKKIAVNAMCIYFGIDTMPVSRNANLVNEKEKMRYEL